MDAEGDPGGPAETVAVDLVQKSVYFALQGIKGEDVIVIDIAPADDDLLHDIAVVLRNSHQFIAEIAADPEDKALIGKGRGMVDQMMSDIGRNQDDVPLGQRIIDSVDVHADTAAQEEIKLIIGVRVVTDGFQIAVIVIEDLKISGLHVLSVDKGRMEWLFQCWFLSFLLRGEKRDGPDDRSERSDRDMRPPARGRLQLIS